MDKKPHERGKFLRPELYNQPKEKGIFNFETEMQPNFETEKQNIKTK